jgi:hypothetical protein
MVVCALALAACTRTMSEEQARQKLTQDGFVDIQLTPTEKGFDFKAKTLTPYVKNCIGSISGSSAGPSTISMSCMPVGGPF